MKINLIIFLSEFNLGGAGNSLFKLCKKLSKKKFCISVICLNKCYYKKELLRIGISVYEINSSKTLFAMPKIKKLLIKLIDYNKKNIFLSNIYYSNILSILFLRSLKIKLIIVERTPFQELSIYYGIIDFLKKQIIKILIRYTYFKADYCISNSKYISKAYNNYYNLKFKTIYPPSFRKFNKFIKRKKLNSNICIGTVCRLSKEKRIDNLIKIFSRFKYNFTFKIIGNGPELENLKKLTKSLNLEKKITFRGKVPPEKITFEIKNFDYFINSSDFEGFPNSVVEALSLGIPVIASQSHGGINEIIKNKNFGFIYNNNTELEIILLKILKNKLKFKNNRNLINRHLQNFSESINVKKYSKVFFKI